MLSVKWKSTYSEYFTVTNAVHQVVVAGASGVPETCAQAQIHVPQANDASGRIHAPAGGVHAPPEHPGAFPPVGAPARFGIGLVEA